MFEKWSKYYKSNLIGLKLGGDLVVVVLSYPLVRQIHIQPVFEGRPDTFFFKLRTMGTKRGITGTDGPLWYEQRLLAIKHMRSIGYGRNLMDEHINREAQYLLKYLEDLQGNSILPSTFLTDFIINILWTMVAGKRFDHCDQRLRKLLDLMKRRAQLFDMSGGLLSQYPWLRFIAPNRTGYNLIMQLNKELHEFCLTAIREHRMTLNSENSSDDFIYAFLNAIRLHEQENNLRKELANSYRIKAKDNKEKLRKQARKKYFKEEEGDDKFNMEELYNDTQLTMTMLDFFIAGSATTSLTLEVALMILALDTLLQNRIFDNIMKNKCASNGNNGDSNGVRMKVPFIDAFIMEVQRLYVVTPITGPRRVLKTTVLDGYTIPKDTTILISMHSVLMDREHWEDPECFRPERFLDEKGEIVNDPYFMPFGQGRRRCLGDALARSCLYTFITKIVEHFHIKLTDKIEELPCLEFRAGITISPKKPYKIRFVKRSEKKYI